VGREAAPHFYCQNGRDMYLSSGRAGTFPPRYSVSIADKTAVFGTILF
jgi:hypothetical protein